MTSIEQALTATDLGEFDDLPVYGTAVTATIVSGAVFDEALAAQAERIALAKEAAEGTQRLPFDEELDALHNQGAHAGGLVAGCGSCDWEASVARVEAEDAAREAEHGAGDADEPDSGDPESE